MGPDGSLRILVTAILLLFSAFFVAAEYGLVGSRRSKLDAMSRQGNQSAKLVLGALDQLSWYLAGCQIGITIVSLALGSYTEPWLSKIIDGFLAPKIESLPRIPLIGEPAKIAPHIAAVISLALVTYVFVLLAELLPKFYTVRYSERVALVMIRPLKAVLTLISPLVRIVEKSGDFLAKLLRIPKISENESVSRDELVLMVRSAKDESLEGDQAQVVTRALRFNDLDASDVMIHRLDMKWIDVNTPNEELFSQVAKYGHTRLPVADGDIDELVGVLYTQDLFKLWGSSEIVLKDILRPAERVPESLTLNRAISRMKEARTQLLIVVDEYGGTSGMVTLEDIVEEVFGELDDQSEASRPAIDRVTDHRLSIAADVRYDELLDFLEVEHNAEEPLTDTITEIIVNTLERMPRLGDQVDNELGTFRVENMARKRITRIAVHLKMPLHPSE